MAEIFNFGSLTLKSGLRSKFMHKKAFSMKAIHFFYIGLAIDALILVLCMSSLLMMKSFAGNEGGSTLDGLSDTGRILLWLIPLLLAALMAVAFWLKNAGKMLPANILLWIPALPMLAGIVMWGGLAVLFIIAGK